MREIKFRYRYEQRCPDDTIQLITRIYTMDEVEEFARPWPNLEKIVSRDEWTGLKDKNGVEIYEGDIAHSDGHGITFRVIYSEGMAGFMAESDKLAMGIGQNAHILEVIGNIYENKELLNDE